MRATLARAGSPDQSRRGRARSVDRRESGRAQRRARDGFRFPRISIASGTTDQRPENPEADIRCNSTTGRMEGYCDGKWQFLTSGLETTLGAVTFTATGQYVHDHGRGVQPQVTVLDSTGKQIEVNVTHTSTDVVQLDFYGTLTDAVLILE